MINSIVCSPKDNNGEKGEYPGSFFIVGLLYS